MTTAAFLFEYLHACANGTLKIDDCGPVWQLGVILTLLVAATGVLIFLRLVAGHRVRKASVRQ
jgi:hypothetical protein